MYNRRTLKFSLFAAAIVTLAIPVAAAAQYRYPDYGQNRYPGNGRNRGYDDRYVRDSIHRLDRLAKDFQRDLDRALDHSRRNGSRGEDQLNADAREFRNAVGDLKSRFGNGRDSNRSYNEAQRVLGIARQIDSARRWFGNDGRASSDWGQIREELRVISDFYGYGGGYGGYGRDDDYRRDRDDDYRRQQRNRNIDDWLRRIPW
jgi:hypothetical protein